MMRCANNVGETLSKNNKPKLIIHETDCHGSGRIYFDGKAEHYSYDDGGYGDVRRTVECLIDLGFINSDDVIIFDEYDNNIYEFVERVMNCNGNT
jgi:hypothetical protein